MTPIFFAKQSDFRKWLQKNHKKETELLVGFYKVDSGKPSITWSQSVDEALCFGWIDGVRKSIDKDSYQIRFTRRKSTSIWSAININQMRSAAAQKIFEVDKRFAVKSAGTDDSASVVLSPELMEWADAIVVMEKHHRNFIPK